MQFIFRTALIFFQTISIYNFILFLKKHLHSELNKTNGIRYFLTASNETTISSDVVCGPPIQSKDNLFTEHVLRSATSWGIPIYTQIIHWHINIYTATRLLSHLYFILYFNITIDDGNGFIKFLVTYISIKYTYVYRYLVYLHIIVIRFNGSRCWRV